MPSMATRWLRVRPVHLYDLRHAYATFALRAGVSFFAASRATLRAVCARAPRRRPSRRRRLRAAGVRERSHQRHQNLAQQPSGPAPDDRARGARRRGGSRRDTCVPQRLDHASGAPTTARSPPQIFAARCPRPSTSTKRNHVPRIQWQELRVAESEAHRGLTGSGAGGNVSSSKPGDRKVGGFRHFWPPTRDRCRACGARRSPLGASGWCRERTAR
jgi:hypothetical protein